MVAFVGASSNSKLTSSSMELTPHASTVDGHVMIAIVTVRTPNLTDDAITGPAGWTLVDGLFESGSPGIRTNVYRRVAASEGAPYSWTFAVAGESVGALLTYSGVDTTSPVLVSAIGGQAAGSTTRITPDIDVTEADCWVLSYFVDRSGSTFTGPDTERVEVQVSASSASQVVCDSAGPVATGITSRTATASVSTSVAIQGILALRPVAEPEPPTFTVPQQWTAAGSRDDLQIEASPAEGSWLIVCMTYLMVEGRPPALGTVADLAANWWLFCGTSTSADGRWQVEVWACPNVRYTPWMLDIVYAAVSHIHATDQGSVAVHVAEVAGFANGFPTLESVTVAEAAAGATFQLDIPAPSQNAFVLAAAVSDEAQLATVSVTSVGWTALTPVLRTIPDVQLAPAWIETSAAVTASWALSSGTSAWVGIAVALREVGEVWEQENPNWPPTRAYLGRGYAIDTPLPRVTWTDESLRLAEFSSSRGIQHELGRPQAAEVAIRLRNYDDAATPVAGGDIDVYTPYQVLAAWDGKIYPLSAGWGEAYTRTWDDPYHGYVDVAGVDAIATLVQDVPSPVRGEILRHQPYSYWPLADQSGSTSAENVSGRGYWPLEVARSKFGVGDSQADFGATVTEMRGDPGTGWGQSGLVAADTKRGSALVCRDGEFPAIDGGVTIVGFIDVPTDLNAQPDSDVTIFIIRDLGARNGQGSSILKYSFDTSLGAPRITVWDKDTGVQTEHIGANSLAQGRAIPFAVRFTRGFFQADHTSVGGSSAITGVCDLAAEFHLISLAGEADERWNGNCGNVTLAHVAVYDRELTNEELEQLFSGAALGWYVGENVRDRMQRSLATADATVPRALDHSSIGTSRDGRDGGIMAQRLADLADYETGLVFGDAAGFLRYRSMARTYQQGVRWVLGDDTANGEIPFLPGLAPTFDPTYLYNRITVANHQEYTWYYNALQDTALLTDGWFDKDHLAADLADSGRRYQVRPLERETWIYNSSRAGMLAEWLLALYRQPRQRVATATVDAARYPAAWPLVLGVEVGDLITVVRRPIGQAPITVLCRVMQIRHHVKFARADTRGEVTLSLAAAPPQVLVCGSGRTLGDSTIGW